ncbi:hypothetical protein HY635_01795 [Candidatus Uhrbacteria bacterium]|nr:hypothetical protein [Candidatus Uhrbacteria bacterium]
MGVYLDLLIPNPQNIGPEGLTAEWRNAFRVATRIPVGQDYRVYAQLRDLSGDTMGADRPDVPKRPHIEPRAFPPDIRIPLYGDGRREIDSDAFERPLTFVTAGQLRMLRVEESSPWNRALGMFLSALPLTTPIVLYWH